MKKRPIVIICIGYIIGILLGVYCESISFFSGKSIQIFCIIIFLIIALINYKNKIIVYNGENLTITNIELSQWTNQHIAYVIDNLGNKFMLNMYYDYENCEFIPDGYISLMP